MIDIDVDLVFCNDSILRVKSYRHGKEIYYPLLDLQSYYQEDASFIIRLLNAKTSFEKNTTLSNVILALEPWQELLSKYTDRHIDAYCVECKKPSDAKQAFSYLKIAKFGTLSRHYQYRPIGENEDIEDYFNCQDCRIETDLFDVEHSVHMSGIVDGEKEQFSTSCIPFSEIKNTDIITANNSIHTLIEKDLSKSVSEIRGITVGDSNVATYYSPAKFTFHEIIYAIFVSGLFYQKPMTKERYEVFSREILNDTNALENEHPNLSLVSEETQPYEEDKQHLKVSIAPGAFDGLIDYESTKTDLWNKIHAQLANNTKIKIGSLIISGQDSHN